MVDDDRPVTFEAMRALVRERGDEGLREVLRIYGSLAARLAVLGIAMEDREREPVVHNYPPQVFVAYKWGDEAHQAWVRELAAEVARRGYDVLLDRDHLAQDASNFAEVPAYIARLVGSDVCLVVVTQAYLDLVEVRHHKTSWVFDEYQAAVGLANDGRLRMCAVWKDPDVDPGHLGLRTNVVDARRVPFDPSCLDGELPPYRGPVLDAAGRARLVRFVVQADEYLAADPPQLEQLRDWLVEHAELGELYDVQVRLVRLYWQAGYADEAYRTALPLLAECREPDHALALAQALDKAGDHAAMFGFLHRARERRYLHDSPQLHYFLGETLHEVGSVVAAGNHFGWLVRSPGFGAFPPSLQDQARERCAQAQAAVPADGVDFHCGTCGSGYRVSDPHDQVCGNCATLYRAAPSSEGPATCPVCGNDGRVPLVVLTSPDLPAGVGVACPVCDDGSMTLG